MKSSSDHKALIRRYLIWGYKSTKESFDRLERKATQLLVDDFVLKSLLGKKRKGLEYENLLAEFKKYIAAKKEQPIPAGHYLYLKDRLEAVEGAIKYFLGAKELKNIQAGYEQEFVRRIWESKEHT